MSKVSKLAVLALAATMTVSFCLADTPSNPAPSVISGQATPTAKSQGKTHSTGSGKAKSKSTGKKVNKAKEDKKMAAKDTYICPMCHITAEKPGKCPMCGMDMVKNEKKDEGKSADEKKL